MSDFAETASEAHRRILDRARPTAERIGRDAAQFVFDQVPVDWTDEILAKATELFRENFAGPELPNRFWSVTIAVREVAVFAYEDQLRSLIQKADHHEAA